MLVISFILLVLFVGLWSNSTCAYWIVFKNYFLPNSLMRKRWLSFTSRSVSQTTRALGSVWSFATRAYCFCSARSWLGKQERYWESLLLWFKGSVYCFDLKKKLSCIALHAISVFDKLYIHCWYMVNTRMLKTLFNIVEERFFFFTLMSVLYNDV